MSDSNGCGFFVPDGFTLKGRVPAVPGLYPAALFTYRPATPGLSFELSTADPGQRAEVAARILCRQLVELRAEGQDGPAVRLTPDQAMRLHRGLFQELFDTVMGYRGPDVGEMEKNSSAG